MTQSRQNAEDAAAPAANLKSEISDRKSKTPLFIGLGLAAAIAVGALIFRSSRREEAPAATARASASQSANGSTATPSLVTSAATGAPSTPIKVREDPKPAPSAAAPISNPKSTISNSSAQQFPPGKWVKVFTKLEDLPDYLRKPDSGVKFEGERLKFRDKTALPLTGGPLVTNFAMRFTSQQTDGRLAVSPSLRKDNAKGAEYQLRFEFEKSRAIISEFSFKTVSHRDLATTALVGKEEGSSCAVEFAAIGRRVFARYDGTFIGPVRDGSLMQGNGYLSSRSPIRDIEVINLDGIPEAEALKILGVDEKGNDLRQKPAAVATSSVGEAGSSPATAGASSKVLPDPQPIRYSFPLPLPKRPTKAGPVHVWRVEGEPTAKNDLTV